MALPTPGRRPRRSLDWMCEDEDDMLDPLPLNSSNKVNGIAGDETDAGGAVTSATPSEHTDKTEAPKMSDSHLKTSEKAASTASAPETESGQRSTQSLTSTSVRREDSLENGCRVKLRRSRPQIFIDTMEAWYRDLSTKKRRTLTMNLLKRKAVQVAASISLEARKIPLDWMSILQKSVGLAVYTRHKGDRKLKPKKAQAILDDDDVAPMNHIEPVEIKKEIKIKKEDDWKFTSCGRIVKAPQILILTKGGFHTQVKATEVIDLTYDVYDCKPSTQHDRKAPSKKPKIIDRSDELPPTWWIEKYNNTGIAPPRELIFYTMQDQTVVCYDYDLPDDYYSKFRPEKKKKQDEAAAAAAAPGPGRGQVRYAHDGNKVEWWAKKTSGEVNFNRA